MRESTVGVRLFNQPLGYVYIFYFTPLFNRWGDREENSVGSIPSVRVTHSNLTGWIVFGWGFDGSFIFIFDKFFCRVLTKGVRFWRAQGIRTTLPFLGGGWMVVFF